MSVAFFKGQSLTSADLKIVIRNSSGVPVDPYYIRYSLFDYTTGIDVLIGVPNRIPATTGTGQYYVDAQIPLDANIGDWIVRWNFNETPTSPLVEVAQEFNVVSQDINVTVAQSTNQETLLRRLRIILRDANPDRNYRFRPPSTEKFMQTNTQVFGYIWEDTELYEWLLMAVDELNSSPPVTGVTLDNMPDRWRTNIIMRAAAFACGAVTLNWIVDEFGYSLSGVSLDLEKSSKYESMKNNFLQEWDKSRELIKASIKIIKGLQQPRYGIGISSALGPYSRPGTQSRRNFVSGGRGGWS
jgi:hypothetical protein